MEDQSTKAPKHLRVRNWLFGFRHSSFVIPIQRFNVLTLCSIGTFAIRIFPWILHFELHSDFAIWHSDFSTPTCSDLFRPVGTQSATHQSINPPPQSFTRK
jgi:hypothetical protein